MVQKRKLKLHMYSCYTYRVKRLNLSVWQLKSFKISVLVSVVTPITPVTPL